MITNIGGAALACTGLALCLGLAGCDAASTTGAAIAPAGVAIAGAVLTVAPARLPDVALCVGGGLFRPDLTLVVTSGGPTVSVDRVTLHLNDGTNLGGPGVIVPQSQIDGGALTVVRAGARRTFVLTPVFVCGASVPRIIDADVDVVAGGTRTVLRATAALP